MPELVDIETLNSMYGGVTIKRNQLHRIMRPIRQGCPCPSLSGKFDEFLNDMQAFEDMCDRLPKLQRACLQGPVTLELNNPKVRKFGDLCQEIRACQKQMCDRAFELICNVAALEWKDELEARFGELEGVAQLREEAAKYQKPKEGGAAVSKEDGEAKAEG